VNTATDFHAPVGATGTPRCQATKVGAGPDVDLYRLLTMDDEYNVYGAPGTRPWSSPHRRPTSPDDYTNYTGRTPATSATAATFALRFAMRPFGESCSPLERTWRTGNQQLPRASALWSDTRAFYYSYFGGQTSAGYELSTTWRTSTSSAPVRCRGLKETAHVLDHQQSEHHLAPGAGAARAIRLANGGSNLTVSLRPLRSNRGPTLE
jgi:hypothetical protein